MKLSEIDAILEKNNPQEEEPREEHAGKLESALVNFGNGILGWLGSTAQGAGMQLKDLQRSTRANNPNDNPNLYDGVFSNAGDILLNEGQYWSKLSDAVSQSDKYRYDAEKFGGRSVLDLVTDLDFWTNAGGAWTAIPSMAGSSYMPMVASMAIPGGALTKGAGALTSPVSSLLGKAGLSKMSQALASRGVAEGLGRAAGFAGVSAPMDALANTSEIIEPLREKGFSDEEIAAIQRAAIAYELPIDLATEFVTGGLMSGVPGRFAGKQFRNLTGRNIPKFIQRAFGSGAAAVAEPISEDVQETYQTITTDKFSGKPYGTLSNPLPEESEAGTQGFLGSLPMSVIESLMGLKPYGRLARMRYKGWRQGGKNANASEESGAPDSAAEAATSLLGERPWQERYEEDEWDNPQGEDAIRGTNVLGEVGRIGNAYNMPTQGDDITEQVATLKAGWRETLPQIGGILKNRFGVNAVISSAGRSEEHNAEVGGAENSYHIVRENGGDAVDIVLPDNTPQETLDAIEAYFKSTGAFDEVLFHDVGSGNHLHLGGLHGGVSGQNMRTSPNSVDAFMSAIMGQESGGNYDARNVDSGAAGAFQIMPENWPAWAENAGLSADAPMTPENQNYVARQKMQEYYNQFGNWRDVAIAWYAGPEAVNWSEEAKNRPQDGYPSVNEYADSVFARMGETSVHDLSNSSIGRYAYDRYFQLGNEIKDGNTDNAGDFDYFGGIVGEIEETGTLSDETRQELEDRYGDDILKNVASKATNHIINQQTTTQETPRTFQTGPSQNQAPIQRKAIETPNLETLQAAQRYGFAGGMNQDLTKQPAVSRLFPTGPNDANNKAAQQQAQVVNNAVQAGQYNPDLTRNTVNDIVQQIAQQEAARQQAQAAPSQNLPALLPMLPPGQSQQQAQPTIQTPTGGQMAASTADAIAGQQQTAPISFLQQPQPAGLQQIIQQIMERGNQNAQNQIGSAAPAPEVYQAGNNQNSNVEPQTGTAAGIADQQEGEINSFLISSFENRISAIEENFDNGNITEKEALAAIRELSAEADKTLPENERKIVKVALTEAARRIKAKAKARQKEESASVLDQPAPMGRDGETYRQFADRMAEGGARLDSRDGKNTIMYGDFGDFSVPQEVADYFTSIKNGQAKSAQKSGAQGGERQANETDRRETIAQEEKVAQNGSVEAREENADPKAEATAKNDRFRVKYKNGDITISLIPNKYYADGDINATVKLNWDQLKEILNADVNTTEEANSTLNSFVEKLGLDPEQRSYYGGYEYWPKLYEALRSLKDKVDSAVRLQAYTPSIQARMKKLLDEKNIGGIVETLRNNDNTVSIKAFSDITGVNLSPVMKTRMEQVKEYFGDEYTKWEEERKKAEDEKEREEATQKEKEQKEKLDKAEKDWNDGKSISGRDFVSLCNKYEVNVPLATKGVLFNKIDGIDSKGTLHGARQLKKYPQGLADAYYKLAKAMKENWASEEEVAHLFGKEKTASAEESAPAKPEPEQSASTENESEKTSVSAVIQQLRDRLNDAVQQFEQAENKNVQFVKTEQELADIAEEAYKSIGQEGNTGVLVDIGEAADRKRREFADIATGVAKEKQEPAREKSVSLENANEKFMEDASVTNSPNVQPYKERAEGVLEDWKAGEITKSEARDFLKEIMSGANRDRYEKGLTHDEMLAAQGFADDALRIINEDSVNKSQKNKEKKKESGQETENTPVEETAKEGAENGEEQEQSGSVDGRHEVERSGESEADERSGAGEVSGRDGREGTRVHGSSGEENSGGPRSAGVRTGTELEEATGNGTDAGRDQSDVSLTEAQAHPSPEETPGHDFEIKESAAGKTNEKIRFKQNIEAIRLLKKLEEENRMPTPAEQEVLGAYNGWGGLKKIFLDEKAKENKELRELLTDEEYNAAKSTMNDAFYTPPKIIRAIWEGVSRLGFKGGRILEPSLGIGNFFGCMPRDMMKHSDMRGIERDGLTSRIAKQLYPNAYVETKEFQKAKVADNYFDLVISNIPFGDKKVDGYHIHNYFFASGMDKVRPGGLMVFITSQGTLIGGEDAAKMRRYLDGKADMIAAYKLPSGTFSEAGTDVATDVVIFQKRGENGQKSKYAQPFIGVTEKTEQTGAYSWQKKKLYDINEYFEAHPENIIGDAKEGTDQYGNPALEVKKRKGETVDEGLAKAMQSLPENIYQPLKRGNKKPFDTTAANKRARADEKTRDLAYYERDGKIYQNQNGEEAPVTSKKAEVVKDYLGVKNALDTLYIAESDPKATDKQLDSLRKMLNKSYDTFVKKHGRLNNPVTAKNFIDDPSAGMVQALEKVKYEGTGKNRKIKKVEKADVFTQRTVQPVQEVKSADTPTDALLASLSNKGTVDLDYMADLLKTTKENVIGGLTGKIFQNPVTEEYETREEYLSGNVREKLAQAETAAKKNPAYQKNVEELKKVIPEDLVSSEILVNMGAPWIPVSDVQDFITSIQGYGELTAKFSPLLAKWEVDGYGGNPKYNTKGIQLSQLLEAILNNKAIEIYSGTKKDAVLDKEATDAANVTAEELRNDFNEWLWSDKEREARLVRYYNDNYNNTVNREYDGSHLNPNAHGMNSKIMLKPHQKNVVWRMLQKGNTLIAHCVGAGKTFEMQTAGMEMRRLGIANKPMYCLPNNVVEQFAREFRQLYPEAKLLVLQTKDLPAVPKTMEKTKTPDGRTVTTEKKLSAKDKERVIKARAERNRTLARVRTEDWDGIIISHDLFQRFPLSPETAADFIREQIDILERTIQEAHDNKMNTRTMASLENKKAALQDRLEDILNTNLDDIGIPFEALGIDQLFVDEADMFKNLHFATSMDRVSGLTNSDANRSNDMFAKTQWLTKAMGGRGVVFATGTPVSNTMAELYTMTRYLDMQGLKEKGLELFDNWIRTFSEIGSGIERRPDGNGYRKVNKVKRFINMAELNKMFRKFADVKTQDDLDLDIPKLKNDKATIVKLDADPEITRYIKEEVPKRVAKMKHAKKGEKGSDNMLALTGDLRKMSLNDDKIEACAEQIAKKYEETTDVKGAQLVFCDIGIPKAQKDTATDTDTETFDSGEETENEGAYEKLIAALKRHGIPAKQIAFVQSAKNKEEMDALFQKVNEGDIRILIGSTQKMGAGTNCQKHLVALHDLDAPWRPRDLEQRHGRILRQGNSNEEVEIFNYVVQDSFDANMWEKLKNKAAIIAQAMSSDTTIRAVEDADLVTLSYAEVEGAATGNPLIKERLNLNNEVTKYAHAQTAFKRRQRDAENTVATHPEMIEEQKEIIGKIKSDIAARKDVSGNKFRMTLSGKTYTERAKAQATLEGILEAYKKGVATTIGEIGGFKLNVYNDGKQAVLQLVGKRAYAVKTSSITGVENTLKAAPDNALKDHETAQRILEQQLSDAQETLKQENPYEEKLKEMTKRLAEIDREIEKSMTEEGKTAQAEVETDSEPVATEEEAAAAAPQERETAQNEGGESAPISQSALKYDGNYFVQETDQYRNLAMNADPQIRDFAEENGGKWEPGVAGDRGGFRFDTKNGAKAFLAGVDNVIAKAGQGEESTQETQAGTTTPQETNFITGDFKHTKTGELIPKAKLKEQISDWKFKQIRERAKSQGGYYNRYAKSFLFKDFAEGRDEFVRQADELLNQWKQQEQGNTKFSASGEMTEAERMRSEARELSRDEWTPQQKKIAEFGEQMGVPVVFIEADPRLHGYHEDGVTYLNTNSEVPIQNVFWHESFHWMRNNNPELYADMMERMQEIGVFSEEDIADYKKSIGRPELTNEEAIEEMLADAMMDAKQREDIMQKVAKADKGLIERFVAWLRETMDAFQAFMKNPDAGLTRAKIAAMNNELSRFLQQVKDGQGNRIFRVTPKGEVRRFDGRALPAVAYSFNDTVEKQRADVRKLYKGTNRWMKAPNGQPTNLTEKQWIDVRTKNFKQWAGDWEAAIAAKKILALPAQSVTVKDENISKDDAKKKFEQFNGTKNKETGTTMSFPNKTIGKILGHQGFPVSSIIDSLPSLFESSILALSETEEYMPGHKTHNNIIGYHHFVNKFKAGNKTYYIRFTAYEENRKPRTDNRLLHSTAISDIEVYPDNKKDVSLGRFRVMYPSVKENTSFVDNKLAYILDSVNNATKVVDENGEPLVVYHWTDNDFEAFQSGNSAGTIYFAPNKDNAKLAARGKSKVIEAFLAVKSPVNTKENLLDWYDAEDSLKVSRWKKQGHDGVFIRDEAGMSIAVFNSSQIKSTNNAGTYSKETNKFDYSVNLNGKSNSNQNGFSSEPKYSVNLNRDRQNRTHQGGFLSVLRNKLAGIVGDGTMRIRKEMKDALERAAGVTIRAGHIDSMTNVKTAGGVIRTRNAYDWETILPEAGKMIAKRLGLKSTDEMGAYIGKWILDGAPNDTSQEAADFQKAMRQHPELQDQILDAHDIFQEWNNMDADKRIEASVQWTKRGTLERLLLGDTTIKDELAEAQKNWYDEWIEELGSLGRLEENIEKKTGKKIGGQESALRAFRLLRGATGKFMTMIEGKDAQAVEAIKRLFPNVNFDGFKTIRMILDDAGVRQDKEGMRQFMTYCIAKHSMSIHKKNEDIELEQLNLERKLKQAKTEEEKAKLRAQIVELGQQIMQAPNTRKDAEATIAKFAKRFGKAQQDLVHFSRVTMDIMVDSGLVSKKRRDEMAKAWPDYVPFFRVFDENEDVQFGDSLKHVSGSKRDLVNPLESIIKNTFEFIRRAEKNKAKLKIANLAKMSDVGEYIQLVDAAKPEDKTVLDYYENGQKKFIQTDPTIVTAIRNMGLQSSTMFGRILRFPAQIARAAFTMANPSFALRNVLRDSADAYLYSKYGYNPLKDFMRGFMHALKQDEMFYEWMASGAAQASMISLDRDYTQSTIDKITKSWREKWYRPSSWLDVLQIAGEYSEYATRIGAYERAKNEIIKRDATISAMGAITEAAFESRDLMDFSRGGKSSRAMNQLIIFSNASIQGWDKFFRTFDFRKDKKAAMAALARLAISAIMPSLALFMLNYDKDWWKEIPDWQKEKHWIIKVGDTILRIPKGQDPGIQFFSNLVEKGMGAMVNDDPVKFNRLVRPLWNTMPDFLPTTFMPFIEVGANYSFFTERNIVPQYQKKLPEKMQYGPHTSSFAKWLGEKIGVAPSHIDHIISGYGGELARGTFNMYDQFAGNQPLNTALEEQMLIRGLTIMPYKNPKSVQEYYEKLDEQEKLYNEFKMTHVRPDGYDPVLYGRMKKARTALQKLSKMERSLMNNPNVSLDDRKARQEQIQARRVEIIKRVMGR